MFSWVFRPVAYLMGVDWEDAGLVAEMIGTSVFITGILAYARLVLLSRNRLNGVMPFISVSYLHFRICTGNTVSHFVAMFCAWLSEHLIWSNILSGWEGGFILRSIVPGQRGGGQYSKENNHDYTVLFPYEDWPFRNSADILLFSSSVQKR